MMSSEEFKCIFCKESFCDKESLQVHFRKHGDRNFHQKKSRFQDDPPTLPDKTAGKDQAEMVECDVCPEVFSSISKAITHKHKVHPDHDAKYFCPWCGKLFTMKHLYNKHIQTTHTNEEKNEKSFHCDVCKVDFKIPAAMSYHNKFFHRINELPTIGNSKKLKMISQEAVQIYYCPFCGEEYENKINLHKHMADDHNDENQHPDDVLRCPVCEAIFYHLDAYELHLTYHCVDDMYSERSAIMDEITDFSLETVPPIAEKVETLESQDGEAMGIEQLFELTMEDTKHKKKKHKKHKKSKKSAITLDQFLNMNTDVFGEGLDFQGVEEVHSQSIAKRLKKPVRKPTQSKLPPDIEKLKRQGIVIKKKEPAVKPLVVKTNRVNKPATQTRPGILATHNDVLTKLINQNNSQIKIVKKSSLEAKSTSEDNNAMSIAPCPAAADNVPVESTESNGTKLPLFAAKESITDISNTAQLETENNGIPTIKDLNSDNKSPICFENNDDEESNHSQSILDKINDTKDVPETIKESKVYDKLAALRNNSNIIIKSSQQNIPIVNKHNETVQLHDEDENNEEDADPDINGESIENNKNDSLNALKHLSHLIVKPFSQEKKQSPKLNNAQGTDKKVEQSEVNKIAHLIRSSPAKMVSNTNKNPTSVVSQTNVPHKIKTVESEESHFDTDDEIDDEPNDKTITEPIQSDKLGSILNSPHLNIQSKKKLVPQKESPTESVPKNEKSSVDLLKHLKNVTAKPVGVNKTVNMSISTPKLSPKLINTIKKEPETSPVKHSKVIQEDIEIFNIDDSDSDEADASTQVNKTENKQTPALNKSADVLKNINKNITVKSMNNAKSASNHKIPVKDKVQIKEMISDNDIDDEETDGTPLPSSSRHSQLGSPQINQKQSALNNVLKNLSKNITVKSGNASSAHFTMTEDQQSQDPHFAPEDESADSDADSHSGRVEITEMNDASDEELDKDINNDVHSNIKVQYPDDSNSDNEDRNDNDEFDDNLTDEDIETHIPVNAVKINAIPKPNLDSLKNVCKDLVIKSSGQTANKTSQLNPAEEIPPFAKSLSKRISIKNMKQADNSNKQVKTNNSNSRNADQSVGQSMNKSAIVQKMATSSNQTVNKEVKTVKSFQTQTQTKTVIQEITTTVTKTIKMVNQSTKQEMKSTGPSPQKIMHLSTNNKSFQGVKVRNTSPMPLAGPRIRNPVRQSRPVLPPIRASNQLIPSRPRFNTPRPNNPRMPFARPSTSAQLRPQIGTQVKLAPGVATPPGTNINAKRPNTEAAGHFSCFKKTKESLFPEDFSAINKNDGESSAQFYSTMQMSKSNFASMTKTVKGNSVVSSSQVKSEMSASTQQLGKLRNLSGLSVVKTSQANQSQVEERSEISAAKQNTLDAIQKLQSQGLLVKKPRLVSEGSENTNPGSDMEHFSDEEDT